LLPVREVPEHSGLFDFFDEHLFDPRGQSVRSCILPVEQRQDLALDTPAATSMQGRYRAQSAATGALKYQERS
jgi:hypothetical protein